MIIFNLNSNLLCGQVLVWGWWGCRGGGGAVESSFPVCVTSATLALRIHVMNEAVVAAGSFRKYQLDQGVRHRGICHSYVLWTEDRWETNCMQLRLPEPTLVTVTWIHCMLCWKRWAFTAIHRHHCWLIHIKSTYYHFQCALSNRHPSGHQISPFSCNDWWFPSMSWHHRSEVMMENVQNVPGIEGAEGKVSQTHRVIWKLLL